jgi:Mrr N-terminal domain
MRAMPTVRISDEVAEELKGIAIPLEDTWDSVLRRILDERRRLLVRDREESVIDALPEKQKGSSEAAALPIGLSIRKRKRRTRRGGDITPAEAYRKPILAILAAHNGRLGRPAVMESLHEWMHDVLTPQDHERRGDGAPHWKNRADWAKKSLAEEGFIRADSAWGIWELTDAGRAAARD